MAWCERQRLAAALLALLPGACAATTPRAEGAPPPPPVAAMAKVAPGVHVVRRGETLRRIAERYGTSAEAIAELNRLRDPNQLYVDQRLRIPTRVDTAAGDGVAPALEPAALEPLLQPKAPEASPPVSPAEPGDDLDAAFARLQAGRPAPRVAPPAEVEPPIRTPPGADAPRPAATSTVPMAPSPPTPRDPSAEARAMLPAAPREAPQGFIWPVDGVVVAIFGSRDGARHDGVDLAAPLGSPIWSAASGRVLYVGEQPGYGKLVIVDHGDDRVTVYAHNQTNLVRVGDRVRQGEPIAQVGQSGTASIPALHFEVRVKKKPANPLPLLPEE